MFPPFLLPSCLSQATSMELVNTMRDLLHLNPLYGEQFRTLLSLSESHPSTVTHSHGPSLPNAAAGPCSQRGNRSQRLKRKRKPG